jgi:hypothetical protein
MLRSKYADPATPTEVDLTFLDKGQAYRVRRNPTYQRRKLRGEGMTEEKASAELHLPDGSVVTKTDEVTARIIGILGVNKKQFCQIAMIAQGDFLKLLLAETKDRQRIFRDIFKTQEFQRFSDHLRSEANALRQQRKGVADQMQHLFAGIRCEMNDPNYPEVQACAEQKKTLDEVLAVLDRLISENTAREKGLDERVLEFHLEAVLFHGRRIDFVLEHGDGVFMLDVPLGTLLHLGPLRLVQGEFHELVGRDKVPQGVRLVVIDLQLQGVRHLPLVVHPEFEAVFLRVELGDEFFGGQTPDLHGIHLGVRCHESQVRRPGAHPFLLDYELLGGFLPEQIQFHIRLPRQT